MNHACAVWTTQINLLDTSLSTLCLISLKLVFHVPGADLPGNLDDYQALVMLQSLFLAL